MTPAVAVLLVGLAACGPPGKGAGGADTAPPADADGDGVADAFDCAPEDPEISPDATEICDGVDNDCDGYADSVDPGLPTQGYRDADGDGFAGTEVHECVDELSDDNDDCDDADASVHPGAIEDCATAADDDCDGEDNEEDAAGCEWYYVDEDGDGDGGAEAACWCEPTSPWTATSGADCDDADGERDPDGGGCRLWGEVGGDDYAALIIPEDDSSSAGISSHAAGDTNGDGYADAVLGDERRDDLAADGGTLYLLLGPLSSSSPLADADARFYGAWEAAYVGAQSSDGADSDGDGYSDLLVSVHSGPEGSALAFVLPGPHSGAATLSDEAATIRYEPIALIYDRVVFAGDQDGDGPADLLSSIWTPTVDTGVAASLLFGPFNALRDVPADGDATLWEEEGTSRGIDSVDAGKDVDGDGISDVVIGAWAAEGDIDLESQWVYVVHGPVTSGSLEDADARLGSPEEGEDEFAYDLSLAGDITGDGRSEIAISDPFGLDTYGYVLVYDGASSGAVAAADALAVISGTMPSAVVGGDLGGLGDLDLDGQGEFAVSGLHTDSEGALYLWYGPVTGSLTPADADARVGGTTEVDVMCLANVGDTDGDGVPDLLAGMPAGDEIGYSYLFRGGWDP